MSTKAHIQMWGNSRAVRIPKSLAQQTGLEAGTPVSLKLSNGGILMQPVHGKKRYRLADLLAECKGRNPHREAISGRVGREAF